MNLLLVFAEEIGADGRVALSGRRSAHLQDILKVRSGDLVRMGVVDGSIGSGLVESVDRETVVLVYTPHSPPPGVPATDLIIAMPRPIMLKRILSQAASLGVGRVFLIKSNRVEKSFFQSSLVRDRGWRDFLLEGLEQAMDVRMPEVTIHERFRPFVEDFLPQVRAGYDFSLIAHPAGAAGLPEVLKDPGSGRVLLALGPEGGWVDFEMDRFMAAGFAPFTMGSRILRLETAVVALLAQIDLLRHSSLPR